VNCAITVFYVKKCEALDSIEHDPTHFFLKKKKKEKNQKIDKLKDPRTRIIPTRENTAQIIGSQSTYTVYWPSTKSTSSHASVTLKSAEDEEYDGSDNSAEEFENSDIIYEVGDYVRSMNWSVLKESKNPWVGQIISLEHSVAKVRWTDGSVSSVKKSDVKYIDLEGR